jgi:hypothetical protein
MVGILVSVVAGTARELASKADVLDETAPPFVTAELLGDLAARAGGGRADGFLLGECLAGLELAAVGEAPVAARRLARGSRGPLG